MERTTTFRFIGSLAAEFPEMIINSKGMASGDALSWVNACLKIANSVGDIINLCLDKNNTRLIKEEVDNFEQKEQEKQDKVEQEILLAKRAMVLELKEKFEKNKKELSKRYTENKLNEYENLIQKNQEISEILKDVRSKLKTLIDIYENELSIILNSEEYSEKEKRKFEECKRLLYKQYNKNIGI